LGPLWLLLAVSRLISSLLDESDSAGFTIFFRGFRGVFVSALGVLKEMVISVLIIF
jgi:hypothetical protein